ncbi:MAG: hypothetical protein NWF02_02855 [Candidatus Bathyarchaeota archaeon]|nr:hypothetical protein [Candidatus Bathyarchaeum sp.]
MEKDENPKEDWRVTLRLPKRDYYFINKLVEDGEYVNSADVIRDAVKHFRAGLELIGPVQSKGIQSLWIFKEEIGHKDFTDWFAAYTSFMLPIHRYKGEMHLFDDAIVFHGKNAKTGEVNIVSIPFQNITDLCLGFDDTYKRRESRSGSVNEAPLRIDYRDGNSVQTVYSFIDFSRVSRGNKNQDWFSTLQKMRSVND